jgi:hypothetical protein
VLFPLPFGAASPSAKPFSAGIATIILLRFPVAIA